ncbi:MAG: hypothetical protein HY301_13775 [Verrucomicrobia bacterium]|nr:hypothetical protein [Verrucomicrobiota bacterium]
MHLKVSLAFASGSDHDVESTADAVNTNLYGEPAYPTPPVTQANLQAGMTAFTAAIGATAQGGTAATADKKNKRTALVELLRQLAEYVQTHCNNDLATLLSSGFQAAQTGNTQSPLPTPDITKVTNGNSGELIARATATKNAKSYEGQSAAINPDGTQGPWVRTDATGDSQHIVFGGLTPGVLYALQVRAVGGSTGHSGWSNTVQHRCL